MAAQLDYHSLHAIFSRFAAQNPDPRGELEHTNAFTLLVAVALSAQATDVGVNRATRCLFAVADTPRKMLDLGEEGLIEHIRTIGLFRSKARHVMRLSQLLIDRFGGTVPSSRAALQSLPGVGRKTANILLGNAFGQPAIGVDTHVLRLARRLGLSRHADPDRVEEDLNAIVPVRDRTRFCHLLQFHGRRVCRARNPRCAECVLADVCPVPASAAPAPPAAAGRARRGAARARR